MASVKERGIESEALLSPRAPALLGQCADVFPKELPADTRPQLDLKWNRAGEPPPPSSFRRMNAAPGRGPIEEGFRSSRVTPNLQNLCSLRCFACQEEGQKLGNLYKMPSLTKAIAKSGYLPPDWIIYECRWMKSFLEDRCPLRPPSDRHQGSGQAFPTRLGLYKRPVMFFGLANARSTFPSMMQESWGTILV